MSAAEPWDDSPGWSNNAGGSPAPTGGSSTAGWFADFGISFPDNTSGCDTLIPLDATHQPTGGYGLIGSTSDGVPHLFTAGDLARPVIATPAFTAGTLGIAYIEYGLVNADGSQKLHLYRDFRPGSSALTSDTFAAVRIGDYSVSEQTGTDLSLITTGTYTGGIQSAAGGYYFARAFIIFAAADLA